MSWNYNRLWIMLIERGMKKTDLLSLAGISTAALAHMSKCEPVTMVTIGKLCEALDCRVEDIIEWKKEGKTPDQV